MSKLAPVTTGQPTQGIGAVAATTRAVPRQHPSPLQAQRAEAENAELDDAMVDAALADSLVPAVIKPHGPVAAATVRTAAWLSLEAKEIEVRQYFRTIAVQSGLEMLVKMRHQCDLAAGTLQQRMDEGNTERCTGCGKTLEEARKSQWVMMGSDMDPDSGVPVPYRFCGPMCVRERNKERMLPKEERNKLRFDGQDMGDVR